MSLSMKARPLKPREAPVDQFRNGLRPGLAGKRRIYTPFETGIGLSLVQDEFGQLFRAEGGRGLHGGGGFAGHGAFVRQRVMLCCSADATGATGFVCRTAHRLV